MKMTSVTSEVLATSNRNISNDSKCMDCSITETSELMHSKSHNDSYICTMEEDEVREKLNKSELDIEIEMCEELLNSECNCSDHAESLNFDKENLSELIDLSDLKNMHSTIFDSGISKCKDHLKFPLEKEVKIILKSRNAENRPSKESNDPLKFTFNELEENKVNVPSGFSKAEASTVILECQNVEQCQNIKCDMVNDILITENTNLLSKDSPETSCKLNENINDNVLYDEQLSDNTPDSKIPVLEKQHSLNLDIEIIRCDGEIKCPLDNYEANTLGNTDLENQDIKNNNAVIVAFNDRSIDNVSGLTLSVSENSHSTNLVCNVSKCNSQKIFLIENDKTSTLKDDDQESNNINLTEFTCDDIIKEKDDDELSIITETDVSTIEEFEMSILDVTDNDVQIMTNESDEFFLSSIKVEENKKTVPNIPVKEVEGNKKTVPSIPVKEVEENKKAVPSIPVKDVEEKIVSSVIVKVPEKPSYEQIKADEREDLLDPRWDKIKKLSTDEERYQQVKNCWKRATVPDPNKNLTYHSFRKRHFANTTVSQPKQHKRMASSNLNEHNAKRLRSCTYHLDNQIGQLKTEIASTKTQYNWQTNHQVESEIRALKVARDEVLHFYKFYKGLNVLNDPTVLTLEQNLELEEIENIYSKFNQLYK